VKFKVGDHIVSNQRELRNRYKFGTIVYVKTHDPIDVYKDYYSVRYKGNRTLMTEPVSLIDGEYELDTQRMRKDQLKNLLK
jgi:bifunctional pyridoxal-dependent enzyme with beta-cystathionase and maltose regulon repressor activities